MLLAFDVGNTNIVLGVYEGKRLVNFWRLKTDAVKTSDEYGMMISQLFAHQGFKMADVSAVVISSVVPELDYTFENLVAKFFKQKALFVIPGTKTGLKIKLENPKQLGSDLIAAAVAGIEEYTVPLIMIDLGTAITIAVINEKKEYLGGVIYPGINTAFSSLTRAAAKLESARMEKVDNVIGKDTVSSIQSGMLFGTASMLDGMIRKIKASYPNALVILSGGHGSLIKEYLEEKVILDDDVVLKGLNIIYKKNKKAS